MTLRLRHCELLWQDYGALVLFGDGATSSNWVPADPAFTRLAADMQMAPVEYVRHHELSHAFLAERMHDAPSPVQWHGAHHLELDRVASRYEERWVYHWQRYALDLGHALEAEWLGWLPEFGVLWSRFLSERQTPPYRVVS